MVGIICVIITRVAGISAFLRSPVTSGRRFVADKKVRVGIYAGACEGNSTSGSESQKRQLETYWSVKHQQTGLELSRNRPFIPRRQRRREREREEERELSKSCGRKRDTTHAFSRTTRINENAALADCGPLPALSLLRPTTLTTLVFAKFLITADAQICVWMFVYVYTRMEYSVVNARNF